MASRTTALVIAWLALLHSSISIFNFNDAFFNLNDSPVVMCVEVCSLPLVIVIGSEHKEE